MQHDPTDPREWLRRARSNLARASEAPHRSEILYEDLCFDAQQATEKALKECSVDFPKTHNIGELIDRVRASGI